MVKLIRETRVDEFEVVNLGVTLMLGHRIKGSRTLDVFRQFKQLRVASPNRMERGEPVEGATAQQAGERSSRGTFSSLNETPPRPQNPPNGIGEQLERMMELMSSMDRRLTAMERSGLNGPGQSALLLGTHGAVSYPDLRSAARTKHKARPV